MTERLLWTAFVFGTGLALAVVLVLVYLVAERVRKWIRKGDVFPRLSRADEDERHAGLLDAIAELEPDPKLATAVIARSPLLDRKPVPPPPAAVRLAGAQHGHNARLDQQTRHANVVTAAGPVTQEFERRVEWETGQPPRGRGPREADVRRPRRTEVAADEWEQCELFEVSAR